MRLRRECDLTIVSILPGGASPINPAYVVLNDNRLLIGPADGDVAATYFEPGDSGPSLIADPLPFNANAGAHLRLMVENGIAMFLNADTCELATFDPVANQWAGEDTAPTPLSNFASAAFPHGGDLTERGLLKIGGDDGAAASDVIERWNQNTGLWTAAGNLLAVRSGAIAIPIDDTRILIAGGHADPTDPDNNVYVRSTVYDGETETCSDTELMVEGRHSTTGLRLRDGRILIVGGRNAGGTMAHSEIYDPATNEWTDNGNAPYSITQRDTIGGGIFQRNSGEVVMANIVSGARPVSWTAAGGWAAFGDVWFTNNPGAASRLDGNCVLFNAYGDSA